MLYLSTILLLALLPCGINAFFGRALVDSVLSRPGACDESFPLAAPTKREDDGHRNLRQRRRVAVGQVAMGEYYETGEYYAPLCPDGHHIDIRKLQRCNGGSCWNEYINQCTFECIWTDPTSRPPTQEPTPSPARSKETDHPLLLSLKSLPEAYRMNKIVRDMIVAYMRDVLKLEIEELGLGMELIEVTNPGRMPGKPNDLPLKIQVRGPADISEFALSYMLQMMNDVKKDIENDLKTFDDGSGVANFEGVKLDISIYDPSDLAFGDTSTPTSSPILSSAPTPFPQLESEVQKVGIMEEGVENGIHWWVWLIVVLATLLCFICCICYCMRLRRGNTEEDHKFNESPQVSQTNIHINQLRSRLSKRRRSMDSNMNPRPRRSDGHRRSRGPSFTTQRSRRTVRTRRTDKRPSRRSTAESAAPSRRDSPQQMVVNTKSSRSDSPSLLGPEVGVPVVPVVPRDDPPEENVLALYDPRAHSQNQAPHSSAQAEPEGDKVMRKQSVFADAHLMSEVRREQQANARKKRSARKEKSMGNRLKQSFKRKQRSDATAEGDGNAGVRRYMQDDPIDDGIEDVAYYHSASDRESSNRVASEPAGMLSNEAHGAKKKKPKSARKEKKNSDKKVSSSKSKATRSMGDRLKQSFNWKQTEFPIDIEALSRSDSGYDSPSILTNHNAPGDTEEGGAHKMAFDDGQNDGGYYRNKGRQATRSNPKQKKTKKSGNKKGGIFSSMRRKSLELDRDGVVSDEESFHMEDEPRMKRVGSYSSASSGSYHA